VDQGICSPRIVDLPVSDRTGKNDGRIRPVSRGFTGREKSDPQRLAVWGFRRFRQKFRQIELRRQVYVNHGQARPWTNPRLTRVFKPIPSFLPVALQQQLGAREPEFCGME
jgi:hypothetical protein